MKFSDWLTVGCMVSIMVSVGFNYFITKKLAADAKKMAKLRAEILESLDRQLDGLK